MDSYSKNSIFRGKVKWIVCIVKAILQWILTPKLASLRGKVKWIVCIFTGILKWIFTPKIACFRGKVKGIVASMKPLKRPPQNVIQHHALKKYVFICNCFMPGSFGRCFDCASFAGHEGQGEKEACSVVRTQKGVPDNLLYLFDIGLGSLSPASLRASRTTCVNSHVRSFLHVNFAVTLDFTFFIDSHV